MTWRRPLAAAAVTLALAIAGCVGDDGSGEDAADGDRALVALVVASGEPLAALRAERTVTAGDAIGLPPGAGAAPGEEATDLDTARRRTDEAIAAFGETLAATDHPGAEQYHEARDHMGDLAAVRAGVDALPASTPADPFAGVAATYDAYDTVVAPVLDATAAVVPLIDDTDLWSGAALYGLGQHQVEATARLAAALPGAADGAQSPQELSALSQLAGELSGGRREVAELAAGTDHEAAAAALEADLAAVGFAEPFLAWLDAGADVPLDVSPTVASLTPPGGGWVTFVAEVQERLLR